MNQSKPTSTQTPSEQTAPRTAVNTGKPPHTPGEQGDKKHAALELPHERDEGLNNTSPQPDPKMKQAHDDIESGQVDTDLRATPGLDARRRRSLLRGRQR